MSLKSWLQSTGWNLFSNKDPTKEARVDYGYSYSTNPEMVHFTPGKERTTIASVYTRIATDCAAIDVVHAKTDKDGRYEEEINSDFNKCLTQSANIDQTGRAFIQDIVERMLDWGVVCVAPVDTSYDPDDTDSYKIYTMRTAQIIQWYPHHVRIKVYNDRNGKKQEVLVAKSDVAIIQNPFYSTLNQPNSTMQRLINKLNMLDVVDKQTSSGKLDLIIKLPYQIKSEARRKQAETRRKDIEMQLTDTKYGIAYTDSTEQIVQLNRSVDNQMMNQIEYLTNLFYTQLGVTQAVLDGTANEETMQNYYNRTVEPIMAAITLEMKRKFLTQTAISQGQSVLFFRDPFKLIPISAVAELADKMTRNEIMTSNEIRQAIGMKPSKDPSADELRNKNLNQSADEIKAKEEIPKDKEEIQNGD